MYKITLKRKQCLQYQPKVVIKYFDSDLGDSMSLKEISLNGVVNLSLSMLLQSAWGNQGPIFYNISWGAPDPIASYLPDFIVSVLSANARKNPKIKAL